MSLNDDDFENDFEKDSDEFNEEDTSTYKKTPDLFWQATGDYKKARQDDLDGNSLLQSYVKKGLTSDQAHRIVARYEADNKFNKGTSMNNNPFSFMKEVEPSKPLANCNKITLKGLKALPPREYLIKRLEIERGTLALLVASGSSGKSMLIQYMACCISSGKKLFGEYETTKGSVVHLDQEQNATQTQRRYERLAAGLDLDCLNIERIDLNRRLDSEEQIQKSEDELVDLFKGHTMVFIDSLKATSEADENSPQIEVVLKILKRVAEKTGTGIILVHHKGKTTSGAKQTGRGHSSIYDSADIQIDLDWDMETFIATLVCKKNRDGKLFDGISYKLLDTGDHNEAQNCSEKLELALLNGEVKRAKNQDDISILNAVKASPGINHGSLYKLIEGDKKTFDATLDTLVKNNSLTETRGARNARIFTITESGESLLTWSNADENK